MPIKSTIMKKEKGIFFAAGIGIIAAIGIYALRRFLENENHGMYFNDYKQHFTEDAGYEDSHGVEFLSFR